MKKIFCVFLVAIIGLTSCNQLSKSSRIVSSVPIKTEILGIELCKKITHGGVEDALMDKTDKYFLVTPQKNGNVEVYRSIPFGLNFNYGGLSWSYVDVGVTKNSEVYVINIVGSYESEESAKQQYDAAVAIFTQKYGKGNVSENNTFWTDDVNSVGLTYYKSSALNGSDRSFCELYYVNRELSNRVEAENQPDI
jgi:hypothetical protein